MRAQSTPPLLRRSLPAQGAVLALVVTAATAALVGVVSARWMGTRLSKELDRRGSSVAAMMERHKDLHTAVLRRDAESAGQVLQLLVESDAEMQYAALLDPKGKLLAAAVKGTPDPGAAVRAQLGHHPLDTPGLADSDAGTRRFTQAVAADEGEKGIWAGSDEQLYAAGTTIGYVLLGMRDRSGPLATGHTALTVSAVALALVAAFLCYFLWMARRLERILRFAERLAAQDLSADLGERSPDEIGRVAAALRGIRDRTREVVTDLAAAAAELRGASAAVHRGAQEQRAHAEGQAARVSGLGTALLELERSSRLTGQGAEEVIRGAGMSSRHAGEGQLAVAEAMDAVEELRREMTETEAGLRQLASQSARIDEITRTVADLSECSHVLAINTGIQAARVGADGRAFQVVASEMRNLADGSRQATVQARVILSEIARVAERSCAAAVTGHARGEVASARARSAAQAIGELASAVLAFANRARNIAENAREQAASIEAVSSRMEEASIEAGRAAEGTALLEQAAEHILVRAGRLERVVVGYRRAPALTDGPEAIGAGEEKPGAPDAPLSAPT